MCSRLRRAKHQAVERPAARRAPARGWRRWEGDGRVIGGHAASVGAWPAGEGEEDVVERRLAAVDVDGVDARVVECADDLDEARASADRDGDDAALARRRSGRRANGASAAAAARARSASATVTSMRSPPICALSSAGEPCGDLAVVEHDDVVGQPVGLLEILSGEHQRGAVARRARAAAPRGRCGSAGRVPWWARRGTAPAGRRRGSPRGRAGGACRPRRCARAGRRRRSGRAVRAVRRPARGPRASAGGRAGQPSRGSRGRSSGRRRWRAGAATPIGRGRAGSPTTSRPATWPARRWAAASVVRIRMAVVLPAPLWPRRPSDGAAGTSRSRSRRAHRSP